MGRKYPNSYCKKCHSFSQKYSNESCATRDGDGSICGATLFGIMENEIKDCTVCSGMGVVNNSRCISCYGSGYEYIQ